MYNNNIIPRYLIRGLSIWGFRNRADFIDYLFAGGRLKTGMLVAINAEKVLNAERNAALKKFLDEAEYKYADGISIVRSIRRKYQYADVNRITGVDLWKDLMARAGREGTPVFLVGGRPLVLIQTEEQLRARWNVNIVGRQDGYFSVDAQLALVERIRVSRSTIVSVAMGSPRQEQLMALIRQRHLKVLCMGVGGTYDAFTGHVKRAPKGWQDLGLEWLYRLLNQPSRLQRQLKLLRYLVYHVNRHL